MMNTRGYGLHLAERLREVALPEAGTVARFEGIDIRVGFAAPPKHYDEDRMLGWMKKNKLGTPATRHQIIEDLLDYGFLFRTERGGLQATAQGTLLVGILEDKLGDEVTGITYARQLEEFIERIGGMAKDRPTRARLWDSVSSKVRHLAAKLLAVKSGPDEAFCPRTGLKVTLHESGKYFQFAGFKDARCWRTMNQRTMSAVDYATILSGGDRGAGPFSDFISQAGNHFDAYVVWRPRKKKFELLFKR